MRIVFGVHGFPPGSSAGVEVYTLRLGRALAARGHEVHVVTAVHDLAAPPYAVRRRSEGGVAVLEVVNVHSEGTLLATYEDPRLEAAVIPILRELRPDVVHFQHLLNLSVGLVSEARRLGARVALTLHDYWLTCPRDGLRMQADGTLCRTVDHAVCSRCLRQSPYLVPGVQRGLSAVARTAGVGRGLHRLHAWAPSLTGSALAWMRRLSPTVDLAPELALRDRRLLAALSDVDWVLSPTRFVRDQIVAWGLPASRIEISPYGAVLGPTRPRPAGRRRRFAFIGTVAPHKGVHVLVEAFRKVDATDASLDIHGPLTVAPAYASTLRQMAGTDPRIRFHGPFAEGGQAGILAGVEALVVPSIWWENSPLTALEALAAGVPVVATRTGGVPEIVADGVAGVLTEPGDVAGLAAVLADLIAGRRLTEPLGPLPLRTVAEEAASLEARYASGRGALARSAGGG